MVICFGCQEWKPHRAKGLCRLCYQRKWHRENAEACREAARKWRNKNREKNRETKGKWRRENPESCRESKRRYNEKNRKRNSEYTREYNRRLRAETLAAYGDKCGLCGIDDPDVLTIDHINGNGKEDRALHGPQTSKFYGYLRREGWPKDNYRLLCRNCNWKERLLAIESRRM